MVICTWFDVKYISRKCFILKGLTTGVSQVRYIILLNFVNFSEIEPPEEAREKERELQEKRKNFDKKNPWGDIAEEWVGGGGKPR